MDNYCVYRHTSPSGKVYIGITGQKPKYRWNDGKGYKECKVFYNAIKKYGWENITHEILFHGCSKKLADILEVAFIKYYKDRGISYNITNGGDGHNLGKDYDKDEYSKTYYETHKDKMREYYKNRYSENKSMFQERSRKYYEEHKEHIIEKSRIYKNTHREDVNEYMRDYKRKHKEYYDNYRQSNVAYYYNYRKLNKLCYHSKDRLTDEPSLW